MGRVERVFPTLTPAQMARVAARGHLRPVRSGEVLVEAGAHAVPFFVLISGEVEVVRLSSATETLIALYTTGQFSGEVNMITGRPALFLMRARRDSEVIELDRERVLALVQTDAELGEILMRAFILRRVELVAQGLGDAVLIGSFH